MANPNCSSLVSVCKEVINYCLRKGLRGNAFCDCLMKYQNNICSIQETDSIIFQVVFIFLFLIFACSVLGAVREICKSKTKKDTKPPPYEYPPTYIEVIEN